VRPVGAQLVIIRMQEFAAAQPRAARSIVRAVAPSHDKYDHPSDPREHNLVEIININITDDNTFMGVPNTHGTEG
jgi:hypothetical protein